MSSYTARLQVGEPSGPDGTVDRAEVLRRAVGWVIQEVPYSQTSWWTDEHGTYRQDCSGYVSMVWDLARETNYWTGNLATVSHQITSAALRPGDILLLPQEHTVIFAGWADVERTRFNLFEQFATGHPARYAVNASLSYYLDRGFGAFRYSGIEDTSEAVPSPLPAEVAEDRDGALVPVGSGVGGPRVAGSPAPPAEPAPATAPTELAAPRWSPELAASYEPENVPSAGLRGTRTPAITIDFTPTAVATAQRALDDPAPAVTSFITSGTNSSDPAYVLVGGFGLLLLAIPLAVGTRARTRPHTRSARDPRTGSS